MKGSTGAGQRGENVRLRQQRHVFVLFFVLQEVRQDHPHVLWRSLVCILSVPQDFSSLFSIDFLIDLVVAKLSSRSRLLDRKKPYRNSFRMVVFVFSSVPGKTPHLQMNVQCVVSASNACGLRSLPAWRF